MTMPDWNDPTVKATTAPAVLDTIREYLADPEADPVRVVHWIADAIPDEFLSASRAPYKNANAAASMESEN